MFVPVLKKFTRSKSQCNVHPQCITTNTTYASFNHTSNAASWAGCVSCSCRHQKSSNSWATKKKNLQLGIDKTQCSTSGGGTTSAAQLVLRTSPPFSASVPRATCRNNPSKTEQNILVTMVAQRNNWFKEPGDFPVCDSPSLLLQKIDGLEQATKEHTCFINVWFCNNVWSHEMQVYQYIACI